ncbi:ABC transporter permease [Chitinophagales bacterium]|nr:ABC transporter permease [Chitinophagales bacterium]
MNHEFFIAKRMSTMGKGNFSGLISKIAIGAVAISLAVMIIATSVVTGFKKEISDKVFGFSGHIMITGFDNNNSLEDKFPINRDRDFYPSLEEHPDIRSVQVYAHKSGIITKDKEFEGVILKGIGSDFDWDFFDRYLIEGEVIALSDTAKSNDILLSSHVAKRIDVQLGDRLQVNFIQDRNHRYRKLTVRGIYKTGLKEFDERFALIDIGHIEKLNSWNKGEVGGFMVTLENTDKLAAVTEYLNNEVVDFDLRARSVRQLNPGIFEWLALQNWNERIILTLMILVGIINVVTALLILILERTNMIGILKALGMQNISLQKIFLFNAAFIIGWGLLLGNVLGLGLCAIQHYTELITLPEDSYYLSVVPVNFSLATIAVLNLGTFLVSVLTMIIPSYLVSWVNPIKAIRFD